MRLLDWKRLIAEDEKGGKMRGECCCSARRTQPLTTDPLPQQPNPKPQSPNNSYFNPHPRTTIPLTPNHKQQLLVERLVRLRRMQRLEHRRHVPPLLQRSL